VITSRANGRVKAARGLAEAKERKRTGLFADEGEDALRSALAAGITPVEAFVDDDLGSDRIADELYAAGTKVHRCSTEVMAALSSLSHTSRAVGVLRANDLPPLVRDSEAAAVSLQLHGVSDPGNLGTLVRSAQGFGPAHVALADDCADPLSPRAVRASMGALYSVPVITLREAPLLSVIALDARGDKTLAELAPRPPIAFALGGERSGLPEDVTSIAEAVARIPLAEGADSLNVAIAGALALYELRR
jgi:RNA methyltransferase, TrmH family